MSGSVCAGTHQQQQQQQRRWRRPQCTRNNNTIRWSHLMSPSSLCRSSVSPSSLQLKAYSHLANVTNILLHRRNQGHPVDGNLSTPQQQQQQRADDEDDDGGLNDSTVYLSGCHHRQAADIVITAVRRRSVPCTGMEIVSQLVVSSVVAGMCTEGCTGTSCTTASHPTDSHQHCTFAVIECCQHVAPPQPATSSSPSPTLPSSTTTAAVFRHLIFCQRGITPRPQPSLHAAGFKQLTALDAVGSWTTTPFGSKEVAIVFLVRTHVLANVAQERFKDYDNDSVPFMKNILQHANDRQYRMLRGLMGVFVCKDMFAPDAHDLMRIMLLSRCSL
ncbi:hypothetical protein PTSG_12998 [Salpingoeca rosetta]|uniref:Uncharacterized protein n=1 Tax=Salpingoeca rosetta (strain ATCC 50818 / BSB-021) TaxID=946362 RepID=F2UPJ8_SALR5|nr:uncharacterized protein PTSG_12998 [Salpingoeca rosetta]EGD79553.1 hypothetical protein PTSG_12998 [Salpingoeca rosetta]|eukprot:XP_004989034.1 hypothetical protein PTSG_12998 [Salpingoeca rosetta]